MLVGFSAAGRCLDLKQILLYLFSLKYSYFKKWSSLLVTKIQNLCLMHPCLSLSNQYDPGEHDILG